MTNDDRARRTRPSGRNPDRTVLDEDDKTEKRMHDQDWPEVAEEVKKAVEEAETKP